MIQGPWCPWEGLPTSPMLAPISASIMQVGRNTGFGPWQCSRSTVNRKMPMLGRKYKKRAKRRGHQDSFSSHLVSLKGYSSLPGKNSKTRQNTKLFPFSIFSSHSPHLYVTLCSHSPDCAFRLLMRRFSLGPSLRLSPWADGGYFTKRDSRWQPPSRARHANAWAQAPFQVPPPLLLLSAPPLTPSTPTPYPAFMPKWEGLDMYGACSVLYAPVRFSCLRQLTQVSAISPLLQMWKLRLGVRQPVHRPRLLALRPRILAPSESADPCSHSSHLPDTLVLA